MDDALCIGVHDAPFLLRLWQPGGRVRVVVGARHSLFLWRYFVRVDRHGRGGWSSEVVAEVPALLFRRRACERAVGLARELWAREREAECPS